MSASPGRGPVPDGDTGEGGIEGPAQGGPSPPRVFGLDLLRAAAILLVLAAHGLFNLLDVELAAQLSGIYGVELFFVLSGFLIGGILVGGRREPRWMRRFWLRRWMRTLPLYFLLLAVNLALAASFGGIPPDAYRSAVFLQNLAWPIEPFFYESWSLAVEEWFYLLLPVAIATAHLAGVGRRLHATALAALALVVGSLAARLAAGATTFWELHTPVVYRLDAVGWGVLAVCAWVAWPDALRRHSFRLAAAGGALLGVAVGLVASWIATGSLPGGAVAFSIGSAGVALLVPLLLRTDGSRHVVRPVTAVSRWSYALYLVHLPVLVLQVRLLGPPQGALEQAAYVAAWLLLSFATAAFLHRWFEQPIMDLRERLRWARRSQGSP